MDKNTMPPESSAPTLEAIAKFSTALFHVLEEAHGMPLLPLTGPQAAQLNNLLDAMLLPPDEGPLSVHDKAGLRQLQSWLQQGVLP